MRHYTLDSFQGKKEHGNYIGISDVSISQNGIELSVGHWCLALS